jgi:hypothetical protein
MTDLELLELAAKAAGIIGEWVQDKNLIHERWYFNVPYDHHNMLTGFEWNPLTDDGDALRLAVKLQMTIHIDGNLTDVQIGMEFSTEAHFDDPYAATRRAIVRAAAEIGKTVK